MTWEEWRTRIEDPGLMNDMAFSLFLDWSLDKVAMQARIIDLQAALRATQPQATPPSAEVQG